MVYLVIDGDVVFKKPLTLYHLSHDKALLYIPVLNSDTEKNIDAKLMEYLLKNDISISKKYKISRYCIVLENNQNCDNGLQFHGIEEFMNYVHVEVLVKLK